VYVTEALVGGKLVVVTAVVKCHEPLPCCVHVPD
jgi:hypothetical protein